MHLPKNLEIGQQSKEQGIWGETLFHGKRARWGTIPLVGMRGERPETEIWRGPPSPFLGRRERETTWGKGVEWVWGELELPLPALNPHALTTAR